MCMTAEGFSLKNFKNGMKKLCIWENERFLTKYGHESGVLREWTIFDKYGYEGSGFFREKSEKKSDFFWLFGP